MSKTTEEGNVKLLNIRKVIVEFNDTPIKNQTQVEQKLEDQEDLTVCDVLLRVLGATANLMEKLNEQEKIYAYECGRLIGLHEGDDPVELKIPMYNALKKIVDSKCKILHPQTGKPVDLMTFIEKNQIMQVVDGAENQKEEEAPEE